MVHTIEVKDNKEQKVINIYGHLVITSSGQLKVKHFVNQELRDVLFTKERERYDMFLGNGDTLTIENHSSQKTLSVYLIER